MTNNDIFKKLRVALMLRDDEIVEILKLVDFNISKSELGAFFRSEDHPNYMECQDQILRNFLNGLILHLRGTKENPKRPADVLAKAKPAPMANKPKPLATATQPVKKRQDINPVQKRQDISPVKYKNKKKS